ncbi:MAG: helix-turn-helix domain-containing protein [Ramlibacter sp.]|nr:helix-turn-helix domain-containing protein [Ramlibacter sp.]
MLLNGVVPREVAPPQAAARGAAGARVQCSTCRLRDGCLPCGLGAPEVGRLDSLRILRRKVEAGEALFRAGEKFHFIFAVRSGTFKSSLMLPDGREQVSGFPMAGELMGLDGMASDAHASTAVALEDAEVCAIPYTGLAQLAARSAGLHQLVSRTMSREIVRENHLMLLLGSMSAEERLAAFLFNLSLRLKARGYSESEFHLRMSRAEIGSYLGVKLETVSRTFSAFQQQRLLDVDKRHIRILDMPALARLSEARA